MNPDFQRLMNEATRLTRAGDLAAATAAIQSALGGAAPAPAAAGATVIDVDARWVDGGPSAPSRPVSDAGSFISGTHQGHADARDYKLYLPPGSEAGGLPLVVMLHGCTQDPDDFAAGTAMNEAAHDRPFLVLYPAQAQKANPQRCWNWFKHSHQQRDRGEPALLAGMTRAVIERHGVDPRRVYVAGLSAGGAMAGILGLTHPDLYAAVGVHSGLAPGVATDLPSALAAMRGGGTTAVSPPGPVPPTIVFHGDQDTTVHPANGAQVVDAARSGARADPPDQAPPSKGRRATRTVYRDAQGRTQAEHWLVHGAGHAWSGGRAAGSYTDPQGPDATQEMLRFFFAHTLGGAG